MTPDEKFDEVYGKLGWIEEMKEFLFAVKMNSAMTDAALQRIGERLEKLEKAVFRDQQP